MTQPLTPVERAAETVPSSPEEIIRVEKLWKVFGRDPKRILSEKYQALSKSEIQEKTGCIVGLKEIGLTVNKGEFFIIMGLSGSGKSTLIRNLIRLVNPTSGTVTVKGCDITKLNENDLLDFRKKTFGMVFQHYGLLPHLTVLDNAAYGLKVRGLPKEEQHARAMQALETVGLQGWENYYPGNLSGGMQQRVGLARALANDPDILLMDEPFSGLDPLIRRQMQDEFVELQDKLRKTIVFVTHDLTEALKLGDRIAILHDGEVAQIGTPEEIVTEPADDYVSEFIQDASPAKVVTAGTIMTEPEVLLYSWKGPKTALTILKKAGRRGSFVVDKERRLLGVVNQERLEKFQADVDDPEKAKLKAPVVKEIPSVTEDTVLEDLFSIVSANPYPVPVVSGSGRLLGVVKTDDIFETISPAGGDNDG
jgi:glycine betaine/proline transport system ATP-binding protein